jgi:hypothetical protein
MRLFSVRHRSCLLITEIRSAAAETVLSDAPLRVPLGASPEKGYGEARREGAT